jgi:beta-phosphoglucomutase
MKEHLFTIDPWVLREKEFDPAGIAARETLFTLGNGYLGVRGCHEELSASWWRGTYVNGFYESRPIIYGERAYGYADRSQTILNCTDTGLVDLFFGGERFSPDSPRISSYLRELDLRNGVLKREIEWIPPSSPETIVRIISERLVPYQQRHLVFIRYRVTLLKGAGTVQLRHTINGDVSNLAAGDDPRTGSHIMPGDFTLDTIRRHGDMFLFNHFTKMSGLRMCVAGESHLRFLSSGDRNDDGREKVFLSDEIMEKSVWRQGEIDLSAGESLELTVCAGYYQGSAGEENLLEVRAMEQVPEQCSAGFDAAVKEHRSFLDQFWQDADVIVEDDPEVQQSIRFNLFHLLQGAGRDGVTSLPAKGLTGEGYEGHYFWDTEIYALPFFIYTKPEIAADLLEYRYRTLPLARGRAAQLGHAGALYPWRTINGNESSAYFPAGTAQYHINADIAYAVSKYLELTAPDPGSVSDFLLHGTEILVETARFWLSLGDYIPSRGNAFCINCVTGPDEYTALVNNNYYTNIMAKENLLSAVGFLEKLRNQDPYGWESLCERISLLPREPEEWESAARAMYLPFDQSLGIYAQDDSFLSKARWEVKDIPPEKRPLLLHYHPLTIYRYQVLKQADLVLAHMLLGHSVSRAQKKRDFDYYDPLTTADSSLSPCIQGVLAAELGYRETSFRHFMRTVRMDLDDVNGNVRDGVHTAAMAGSWISLIYGFAGLRDCQGGLCFNPTLPDTWRKLSFTLRRGDASLEVTIGKEEAAYRLKEGKEMNITHQGVPHRVSPGSPLVISLRPEFDAVIFDLDGVITDSAEYHFLAWKQLCDELLIPFDREFNHKLKGVSRMASLELLLSRSDRSFSDSEKSELAARKNSYYQELIKQITPKDLLPGIDVLLSRLREAGICTALASASRNAAAILDYLQIADRFDVVTSPDDLVKGKPDPEQFFLAAELLKVPYGNCIGIEDAQAGIDAINSAGMLSVGIGDYLENADLRLSSTDQLSLEKLRELFYR